MSWAWKLALRDVIAALKGKGVVVTSAQVSTLRSKLSSNGHGTSRALAFRPSPRRMSRSNTCWLPRHWRNAWAESKMHGSA